MAALDLTVPLIELNSDNDYDELKINRYSHTFTGGQLCKTKKTQLLSTQLGESYLSAA